MVKFVGPPKNKTRNKPIADDLKQVLDKAAQAAGVDTIDIVSGGQDVKGQGTRRTGSTRHDGGRAADIKLLVNGKTLTFTDQTADPKVLAFVTAAAAAAAIGIGAGIWPRTGQDIHDQAMSLISSTPGIG